MLAFLMLLLMYDSQIRLCSSTIRMLAFQLCGSQIRQLCDACLPVHKQKPSWLTEYAAHHDPLSYTGADLMQVTDFQGVASEFLQRLKTTGPGLPNTDLAKGLELLKKFQVLTAALSLLIAHAAAYKLRVIFVSSLQAPL